MDLEMWQACTPAIRPTHSGEDVGAGLVDPARRAALQLLREQKASVEFLANSCASLGELFARCVEYYRLDGAKWRLSLRLDELGTFVVTAPVPPASLHFSFAPYRAGSKFAFSFRLLQDGDQHLEMSSSKGGRIAYSLSRGVEATNFAATVLEEHFDFWSLLVSSVHRGRLTVDPGATTGRPKAIIKKKAKLAFMKLIADGEGSDAKRRRTT